MSHVDALVEKLCPSGVQFKVLGEIGTIARGKRFVKSDLVESGTPCLHYGEIYTRYGVSAHEAFSFLKPDQAERLRKAAPGDVIIASAGETIEDIGKAVAWLGRESIVIHDACYAFRSELDPTYVAYYFQTDDFHNQIRRHIATSKISAISTERLAGVRIPTPPLEVQREIVRILDTFSELEAGLEAELEARKVQYAHYRTIVLDRAAERAELLELGSLGRVVTGHTPKASFTAAWGSEVDFVTPSDIKDGMRTVTAPSRHLSSVGAVSMSSSIVPAGSILVTCIGADMGKTIINSNKCVPNQQINAIVLNEGIHNGYLFHVLTSLRGALRTQGERGGGTMPLINKSDFSRITVPIPPIEIQRLAAAQLDKFDGLVNDLSSGLPAEISARRKQYEYYRDHLLTFKEQPGE